MLARLIDSKTRYSEGRDLTEAAGKNASKGKPGIHVYYTNCIIDLAPCERTPLL
jgi:hypothetical protein